jgi:hypothetical protein
VPEVGGHERRISASGRGPRSGLGRALIAGGLGALVGAAVWSAASDDDSPAPVTSPPQEVRPAPTAEPSPPPSPSDWREPADEQLPEPRPDRGGFAPETLARSVRPAPAHGEPRALLA